MGHSMNVIPLNPAVSSTVDGAAIDNSRAPVFIPLTSDVEVMAADKGREIRLAYIYVLEAEGIGRFKIGQSIDFKERFPTYKTQCPVPCWPIYVAAVPFDYVLNIERAIHNHFAEKRIKGEWFCLSQSDLDEFPRLIGKIAGSSIGKVKRHLSKFNYDASTERLARLKQLDVEIDRSRLANSTPTCEYVLDRLQHANDLGETIDAADLVRSIDRKPQDVHTAIRGLIRSGTVAIVSPRRSPDCGLFHFEEYRVTPLILPDVTCEWQSAWCGTEVLVSEPLGTPVAEYFGRHSPNKTSDKSPRRFRRNTKNIHDLRCPTCGRT